MARATDGNEQLLCSFCGKSQRQVKKLIAGPGVYICDECIDLCNEIIDEELAAPPTFELESFKGELRDAARQLQAAGVAAQAVEKAGNPAATIIETAESGGYDLVVVGVRGRHAIARFLFGSTADRVARHATTPVLVVR